MKCADCDEAICESERRQAVYCGCGAVMHYECCLSDPSTAKDYCEKCYYGTERQALIVEPTQPEAEA